MTDPTAEQRALIEELMDGVRIAYPNADHEFAHELLTQAVVADDAFWRQLLARVTATLRLSAGREAVLAPGLEFAAKVLDDWMLKTRGDT